MIPIHTILHPTDFSDCSDVAFRLACALARDYGARLVVLHVAELPAVVSGDGMLMMPYPVDSEPLREQLQKLTPGAPEVPVEHRLVEGYPAEQILRVAAQKNCDLILMGTHGRTALNRLLMGSVAEQVVRKAPCPVLTVKTPHRPVPSSGKHIATEAREGAPATT
jgi:nucleotide-binding universal stress UspA family protein